MISRRDVLAATAAGAVVTTTARAATYRQPERAAARRDQRHEPRQPDRSRAAEPGDRQPVSLGAVAAADGRWRHAAVLGIVQPTRRSGSRTAVGRGR